MTAARIPARLRRLVVTRAGGRCAFCRSPERLMGVTFEIDHVTPRAARGRTTLANLCLCCPTCNRHKASRLTARDPVTSADVPLFHPVRDAWDEHFAWDAGGTIIAGRTPPGRATVIALQMNRALIVELRRYWVTTGSHPPPEHS